LRVTFIGSLGQWSVLNMTTGDTHLTSPQALSGQIGSTLMIEDIDGLKASGKVAKRRKEKELKAVRL